MDTQTINTIISSIFALMSIILVKIVVPYLKTKMDETKRSELHDFCMTAEAAAAQLFNTNEEKREYVVNALTNYAKEKNINMDSSTTRLILEGIYKLYKDTINNGQPAE